MPHRDQRVEMNARLESQALELARLQREHARIEAEAAQLRSDLELAETTIAEGVGTPRRPRRLARLGALAIGLGAAATSAGYVVADHHAHARAELLFGATRHIELVLRPVGPPPAPGQCRARIVADPVRFGIDGSDPYSCRVRVWCGDTLLYGTLDYSGGYAQCYGARVWDGRLDDGDPALEIDLAEARFIVDDGTRTIVLEP